MFKDFFDGITAYLKALQLISQMKLWKFVLVPGLISLILAVTIGISAWGLSDNLGNIFASWWPFEWGAGAVKVMAGLTGGLLIALLGIILYKHLVMIITAPFMSPLSQKIEEHLSGRHTHYKGFEWSRAVKEMLRGLHIAFRNIFREVLFVLPLLLLSFIPAVGVVATICIFMVQAYYAGFGNMDYTLERHHSVRGSLDFVRNHKMLALGNGAVFMLLLMTGLGFLVAPPLAAIAATLETVPRLGIAPVSNPNADYV